MGEHALEELRRLVVDDRHLRDRLLSAPDFDAFVLEVIEVARAREIELTAAEVVAGLNDARRLRLERWV
jgi:hypothetical protein